MSQSSSSTNNGDTSDLVNILRSAGIVETPIPDQFPPCLEIYEHFLRCAKPRYQVVNYRRYGEFGKCNELFADWGSCLFIKAVKDPSEVEVCIVLLYLCPNNLFL